MTFFQKLKAKPRSCFSISHMGDAALVWLMEEDQNFHIGVDVESSDRKIQISLSQKIDNREETELPPFNCGGPKKLHSKRFQGGPARYFFESFVIKKINFS